MENLIRISENDNFVIDYDVKRDMYRVSTFENYHFRDEYWFNAYNKEKLNVLNIYKQKYRLCELEEIRMYNPIHNSLLGKICYLAYFNVGERGWFLCDTEDIYKPVHRVHTSIVKSVENTNNNQIVVTTQNTKYTFELVVNE